jgi:hypothetical protein
MSVIGSTLPFFFGASRSSGPAIGSSLGGGFFAGYISHTANGVATHALIVAPAATGATGTGYTLTTNKQWKTTNTTTAGTTSTYDGAANTAAIVTAGIADHPAAQFCTGLSIGGYTDWYLPARDELEIAYYNLKPTTTSNSTLWGINAYSVPARGSNYTAGTPAQTSVAAFQTGNSEAFVAGNHWSSTETSSTTAWLLNFTNGLQASLTKGSISRVRAFRKLAL